MLPINNEELIK